jgi:hypothetical protein
MHWVGAAAVSDVIARHTPAVGVHKVESCLTGRQRKTGNRETIGVDQVSALLDEGSSRARKYRRVQAAGEKAGSEHRL